MTIRRYVLVAPDGSERPDLYDEHAFEDAKEAARGLGYDIVERTYGVTTSRVVWRPADDADADIWTRNFNDDLHEDPRG